MLLSVFGSAFGDERCARTNRHVGELHGFIVRVDRFSDGSHGSLPWLAWLATMARIARMARLYDSHGSHGSLARTLSKLIHVL